MSQHKPQRAGVQMGSFDQAGWFSEFCPMWPGFALSVSVTGQLLETSSKYQDIGVYQTQSCGRMLTLDGVIQTTELDEFAYHEMLAHVPLYSHPDPRRVLVVGGGDGGVAREVARHESVRQIDVCEIDAEVVKAAKTFLPNMAKGFDDQRVKLNIADGAEFIKDKAGVYDVVIIDSSDPVGPNEPLFGESFYSDAKAALNNGGVLAAQGESFFMGGGDVARGLFSICSRLFQTVAYSHVMVPTYLGGSIGLCVASDTVDFRAPSRLPDAAAQSALRYYTPQIHAASFVLPRFASDLLAAASKKPGSC